MTIVFSALLSCMGMSLVYSGIAFINGQFLPSVFSGLYHTVPSPTWRMLIAVLPFFGVANLLVAKSYALSGPGWGGMFMVLFTILGMVANAMILDNKMMNTHMALAMVVMVVGGLWFIHGLNS